MAQHIDQLGLYLYSKIRIYYTHLRHMSNSQTKEVSNVELLQKEKPIGFPSLKITQEYESHARCIQLLHFCSDPICIPG